MELKDVDETVLANVIDGTSIVQTQQNLIGIVDRVEVIASVWRLIDQGKVELLPTRKLRKKT
jgi:hypothetical protein